MHVCMYVCVYVLRTSCAYGREHVRNWNTHVRTNCGHHVPTMVPTDHAVVQIVQA